MKETIPESLAAHGYKSAVVSIRRLRDLQEEIQGRLGGGQLDEGVYQSYFTKFEYLPPASITNAASLIVVAYADPPVRFDFSWQGTVIQLTVPPTYLQAEAKDAEVSRLLTELFAPEGYGLAPILLPKKLLAVRSGLAKYGRNNITYVDGLGSYHRLAAFCSDYPWRSENWSEASQLPRCESCRACLSGCPTSAISSERFLLQAGRCLTFWNEQPKRVAFPGWLEDSWHNCLVGCLHCQRVCPENRELRDWYQRGAEFSEQETELLLAGTAASELPGGLRSKLERWDLLQLLDQLPRNLRALLANNTV